MAPSSVSTWEPRILVSRECSPVRCERAELKVLSVQRGGKVEIIANDQGNRITPSWVGFTEDERLIGDAAKNQGPSNPANTVFDAKRMIGRQFDDSDVQKDVKHWPFKIVNQGGKPVIKVQHRNEFKEFVSFQYRYLILHR